MSTKRRRGELSALLVIRFAAAPAGASIARLTTAGLSAQVAPDVHENMADPVHNAGGISILRDHFELPGRQTTKF